MRAEFSLLRGVCQIPAYAAYQKGFFGAEGLEATLSIASTASVVPDRLSRGESQFAVMPWTRVAAAPDLVAVAGSGYEEAAIVVRAGTPTAEVRSVAVPLRGGIKDLTAMALLESLGWGGVEQLRQPSGDGAIIALFGEGADAASMVEPYATMLVEMGVGRVVRRTGDIWPGAPGCSLSTTRRLRDESPELVWAAVRAFARGVAFVRDEPDAAAEIASRYIGVHARFIRAALRANPPKLEGIANRAVMEKILGLMKSLGYLKAMPSGHVDLSFLERLRAESPEAG